MAVADRGACHVILPMTALHGDKSAQQVNVRLAAGEIAVEAHHEIFAEHVTLSLCSCGRVIRKLQLTAIWIPQSLALSCVNKSGTAHGLTQCPIKGDTPYFTAIKFCMLRRALQMQCKGQKTFPTQFWKQLHMTAIQEKPDLRMAAKAVDSEHKALASLELSCHQDSTWKRIATDDFVASFYMKGLHHIAQHTFNMTLLLFFYKWGMFCQFGPFQACGKRLRL